MVKKTQIAFYTFALFLGIILFSSVQGAERVPYKQPLDTMGYGRFVSGTMVVLSAVQLVILAKNYKAQQVEKSETKQEQATMEYKQEKKRTAALIFLTGAVFLFYCLFLKKIGYFTTGFIVLVVYMLFLYKAQIGNLNKKAVIKIIALAIAVTLFIYLIFGVLFELWLPSGIFI